MLKEHQVGASVADLCRKHGIIGATFYTWRSKYRGMVWEPKRLKSLKDENARLKKLLAGSMRDVSTLKDLLAKTLTSGLRRTAVTWAIEEKGYSQRRACGLVGMEPKTFRYAS